MGANLTSEGIIIIVLQVCTMVLQIFQSVDKNHFKSQCCKGCFIENDIKMKEISKDDVGDSKNKDPIQK